MQIFNFCWSWLVSLTCMWPAVGQMGGSVSGVGWLSAGPYRMPLLPQEAHLDLLTCISRLPKPQKQMLQSVSRPGLKTHAMHSPHILGQTSRGPDQAMGHSRPKGGQETPLHGRSWKALWPFSQLTIENSATQTSARVVADPRR